MLPLKPAFEAAGCDVIVTARDVGITLALMDQSGVDFRPVGTEAPGSKVQKVFRILQRAHALTRLFPRDQHPHLVVTASRSAAFAARYLRIPAFIFCDYEYVDLRAARLSGAYVLFPDVIDPVAIRNRGVHRTKLIPFAGLKEGISFANVDVESVVPHAFPGVDDSLARILFRPPAEQAHYYVRQSKDLALALLAHLSHRDDVVVVFAPRHRSQTVYLDQFSWVNSPVLLEESVHFVSLLKAVDAVVSSGGTMLREAAYLGVPAYSILRSDIGSVDRYLESIGRLQILAGPEQLDGVPRSRPRLEPLPAPPDLPGTLARIMLAKIDGRPLEAEAP